LSLRIRLTVFLPISWRSFHRASRILVYPQLGLSTAILTTRSAISSSVRGRPGPRLLDPSYFFAMSLLTSADVHEALGCSDSQVSRLVRRGKLVAAGERRCGKRVVRCFAPEVVEALRAKTRC